MPPTHEGVFLIADITGYTQYLTDSELAHAQETLTALLELLVENTRPPLVISRLAGDAVISYAFRERFLQGQTFLEKIEETYVLFRQAIDRLVLNNTCRCQACANIGQLDLKFFIHYGAFGIQRISDHDELVGADVVLLHRLLKNTVKEKIGHGAYALFTRAAVDHLALGDLVAEMTTHVETIEQLGEVETWIQDMHPVWEARREAVAVRFPDGRIRGRYEAEVAMPPERLWDYLIQPAYRNTLIGSDRMLIAGHRAGRIAPGSVFQCYHGDMVVPQTILAWQPFEHMILQELFPMAPKVTWLSEYRLEPIDGGTRFTWTYGEPSGPLWGRLLLKILMPVFSRISRRLFTAFVRQVEEAERAAGAEPGAASAVSPEQIRAAAADGLRPAGDP